jgi:drug/metabolite transporter (DMT)-like permease
MPRHMPARPEIRGVLTILATVLAMALADAFVKYASADMTLWQIYVLRSGVTIPVLAIGARRNPRPPALGWVMMRSLALSLMYLCIYAAIPFLDLSVVAAALYTGPFFIVALSAIVLREPITGRQWGAILAGFGAVVLIVRPAASGFSPLALLPVLAGFLYAVAAVITRARCSGIPALALALWLNLTLGALGVIASVLIRYADVGVVPRYPFLFGRWSRMEAGDCGVILVLAVLMTGISIGLARAYQAPRPQVIATFDYAYLIFAALWGFVFFGEVPDGPTLAGIAIIALAGIGILRAAR